MKPAERTSSSNNHGRELSNSAPTTIQVLSASQFNLPTKVRSSRKLKTPKMLVERDSKSSENIVNSQSNTLIPSFQDRVLGLKVRYVPISYISMKFSLTSGYLCHKYIQ